jgi:hypothetical protein
MSSGFGSPALGAIADFTRGTIRGMAAVGNAAAVANNIIRRKHAFEAFSPLRGNPFQFGTLSVACGDLGRTLSTTGTANSR